MSNQNKLIVLDLTQRLPGPLASQQLLNQGAEVIKLSPKGKKDAFIETQDPLFNEWYRNLNNKKKMIEIDFKNELQAYIDSAQIIIAPSNFDCDRYSFDQKSIILVNGSSKGQAMHDLNALALCHAFSLYLQDKKESQMIRPPFLPFAGIQYGSTIALSALSTHIKVQEEKKTIITNVYLDKSVSDVFDLFWNKEFQKLESSRSLHNGLFPCYNIYKTKDDKFIALACVEEHYFQKFCERFNLSLIIEDRFDTSNRVFNILINLFSSLTLSEIKQKIGDADICLTPVE